MTTPDGPDITGLLTAWSDGDRAALDHLIPLDKLARIDPRKAHVVELRYFGGLTLDEAGAVLGISAETVLRDWKVARLRLVRELRPPEPLARGASQ